MGTMTCNSSGSTVGLNATTGSGATADIIDVSQTSSGCGISVVSSASGNAGIYSSQTGGASAVRADASTTGGYGVNATNSTGAGTALSAQNTAAAGNSSGNGIHAVTAQKSGSAVWAQNTNGGNGITAQNTNGGTAVSASTTDTGVACLDVANNATTGNADGAFITSSSASGIGVLAEGTSTSTSGSGPVGLYGSAATGNGYGVIGVNTASSGANGVGVYGAGWKYSVYCDVPGSGAGNALVTNGNASISGNLNVTGSITAGGKDFFIDHPLDPENRFLSHGCVESSERKNMYDGVAQTDGQGEVVVTLPTYVEALNGDFRYQLTALGGPAPNLHVKTELRGGTFVIGGAQPNQRVSWLVTGVRHDAWARKNPVVVEKEKGAQEKGLFLHPEAHGKPKEKGIGHAEAAEMRKQTEGLRAGVKERARRRSPAP